jgi:hypothetical protein
MASPAPVYLTMPNQVGSALARFRDVFNVGVQGQVFEDFAEQGRMRGRSYKDIVDESQHCERTVQPQRSLGQHGAE